MSAEQSKQELQTAAEQQPVVATKVANPFAAAGGAERATSGVIAIEQQRAIAQQVGAMMAARQCPRNRLRAMDDILVDCQDPALAEEAEYEFARGGSSVSGPSIRLLETVARRWGNMETGVRELSRADGSSSIEAYAIDYETGYSDKKQFTVRHWRDTKKGGYPVTDERDIYELVANMGARRKRACMEAVIPKLVVDAAVNQCRETLKANIEITQEAIDKMVERFARWGVNKAMIEAKIQRHVDSIAPAQFMMMRRINTSLKDGMSTIAEWFDLSLADGAAPADEAPKTGTAGLKAALKDEPKAPASETKPAAEETKADELPSKPPATEPPIPSVARWFELLYAATTPEAVEQLQSLIGEYEGKAKADMRSEAAAKLNDLRAAN